jgi:hypothetical protein
MHKVREELTVAVYVGVVKIYVAAVEALRIKERQGETQERFPEFHPPTLECSC